MYWLLTQMILAILKISMRYITYQCDISTNHTNHSIGKFLCHNWILKDTIQAINLNMHKIKQFFYFKLSFELILLRKSSRPETSADFMAILVE